MEKITGPLSWAEIQRHIAFSAIGPTTLRNMGADRQRICKWLACNADLSDFAKKPVGDVLDEWSDALAKIEAGPWGAIRKAINLFLRDCALNHLTRVKYELAKIEPLLEIPLDSRTMKAIRATKEAKESMPVVSWVKDLDADLSDQYQRIAKRHAAKRHADEEEMLRVELDIRWWSVG